MLSASTVSSVSIDSLCSVFVNLTLRIPLSFCALTDRISLFCWSWNKLGSACSINRPPSKNYGNGRFTYFVERIVQMGLTLTVYISFLYSIANPIRKFVKSKAIACMLVQTHRVKYTIFSKKAQFKKGTHDII